MASGLAIESLERLAQDVFELVKQLALVSPRGRRRPGDLKEGEFLTLALLQERGTMIVGEIQRELGVLPAQMSRIVRALEDRERPFIICKINPGDKRKVDVSLTDDGGRILSQYRQLRIGRILHVIQELGDEDQEKLSDVVDCIRDALRHGNGE